MRFIICDKGSCYYHEAEASIVGVNYGLLGNNLPPPSQVIALLKSRGIARVRLFAPVQDVLTALENSGIEVILGTLNEDLQNLGGDLLFAMSWVKNNVLPYADTIKFRCISAGNEVIPSDLAIHVFPAMKNLNTALRASYLGEISVSTSVSTLVLGTSYPPSQGEFSEDVKSIMQPIAKFLVQNNFPLLVNVYPYFSYIYNPQDIPLSYALFNSSEVVVRDGKLKYKNLFDATTDAVYSALEKVGGGDIDVVISESGWPSNENGDIATISNAKMYVNSLVQHVSGTTGTPKRPGKSIETYVFATFNENLKPPGTEQNFGLYYPNMTEVYHVDMFTP
ncbi:hypothetical protein RJ639_038526 [Escallonia herrerae]|uniref:Beta-1,3-glucanase n=1 Tax=Escallonia herrerae TaxID=1293975 RepID=A0AA88WRW3_9ASTE|nr:hypothetical protein RJ639_038526 [Escallonia herrerae]